MGRALSRIGKRAGAEFPARQGQIVQNLIVSVLQFLSGEACISRQIHGLDVGIVEAPAVDGQGDGGGDEKQHQRHGKKYGQNPVVFHGAHPFGQVFAIIAQFPGIGKINYRLA